MPGSAGEIGVTVLIVNWNTSALLRACLDSLAVLPEFDELEIVVIDNGSKDDSCDMIRTHHPHVLLIENDANEGFGRANNRGFAASVAPFVLLLNSDTVVEPGAIRHCRDHLLAHHDVGAVGCRINNPDGSAQNSIFRYPSARGLLSTAFGLGRLAPSSGVLNFDRYGNDVPERVTEVEVVMGSFLMVRRREFDSQLLDDGYFMYAEEADLCRRVRERGQRVEFLPAVGVSHVAGASSRTPQQRAWSDEAKKRAQLRFVRVWDGVAAAWIANAGILLAMLPRLALWAVLDVVGAATGGATGRLYKAQALRFHLQALVRPSVMTERFHGPPDGI